MSTKDDPIDYIDEYEYYRMWGRPKPRPEEPKKQNQKALWLAKMLMQKRQG